MNEELLKYIYYNFKGEDISIIKCVYIGPVKNLKENDFFNYNLKNIFLNKKNILKKDYIYLKNLEKYKLKKFLNLEKFNEKFFRKTLDFSNISLNDDERILLFFIVKSNAKREAILKIGRTENLKIWLNTLLIYNKSSIVYDGYYIAPGFSDSIYLNIKLNKGENLFVIELNKFSKMVSLKITNPIQNNNIYSDYYNTICLKKIAIIDRIVKEKKIYQFMIIPKDYINISLNSTLLIKIVFKNNIIKIFKTKFYKKNVIDISRINYNLDCILDIYIYYSSKGKKSGFLNHKVLLSSYYEVLKRKDNINRYIEIVKNNVPKEMLPWIISDESKKMIDFKYALQNNSLLIGFNRIFFRSKLDNTLQNFCVFIPERINIQKKYEIIIHLVPEVSGNFIKFHSKKIYEKNIIFVEFSTRGVTQGSYVGECSILENLKLFLQIFRFKKYDLNLIGYSTGAFAVWAFSQNNPHMIKSIVPIAGFPYFNNLCNLNNKSILNISGDNDNTYKRAFEEPSEYFKRTNPKYKSLILKEADHLTLMTTLFSREVINFLSNNKNEKISKISFRTERSVHNKTNYIRIINFSGSYAKIDIFFYKNNIYIYIENIYEFIFYIPKFLKNKTINIFIKFENKKNKFILNYRKFITFTFENGEFKIVNNRAIKNRNINKNKGMGLLNVYMDSLKIFFYNSKNKELYCSMLKICESMKNLKTMGHKPNVNVDYSIEAIKNIDKSKFYNCNAIIVNCEKNKFFDDFKNKFPIKLNSNSIEYKNQIFKGDYSIVFIMKNPFNKNKNILIVYSTKHKLFNKNFFLRNFIIPSYSNGIHKWLNSECLVNIENKYMIIENFGDDINF